MKKSLIALAVAGVVSAPAFAATSNVDVYGKLHVSASLFDDQAAGVEDLQISSNASRIGFKGSEDLGGGLAAIWQIETGINIDEANGSWASRNVFVGLKSDAMGTVMIGNYDTPLKLIGRSVDLFGDTMADSRNVTGVDSDTRGKNSVTYMSPSFSGLAFAAQYSNAAELAATTTSGTAGDMSDDSFWSLNGTYTNGPLFVGLGYSDGDALETRGVDKEWRVAAGYSFGNFKVVGQYDKSDGETSLDADFDSWMLGAAYTMGNVVLKANYMDGDVDGSSPDPKQWTIGADYNLSKRTSVYALYADGENVSFGSGAGGSDRIGSGVADGDVSVFSLGMIHTF
ncbi:porin [Thiobacillus denitrificans]|uniref:porin n=1 Tax=Thiobacillus denitrificans TaxID=36861 RepID=UPI0003637564|nr:porin [Thiobacillus denitrificans]